jgi:hypothetical protein
MFVFNPYDFLNLFITLLVIIISYKKKIINIKILICFLYSLIFIFVPPFLFDGYGPFLDQSKYIGMTYEIRSSYFSGEFFNIIKSYYSNQIFWTSLSLSLVPLPIANPISVIIFVKLIFFISIIYLRHKNFLSQLMCIFLLIYPSYTFYSSLALKDILIVTLVLWSLYFFLGKKYFSLLFVLFILFLLRSFFIPFILIMFSSYLLLFENYKYKKLILSLIIFIILFIFLFFLNLIENYINFKKIGFISEMYYYKTFPNNNSSEYINLKELRSYIQIIQSGFSSFFLPNINFSTLNLNLLIKLENIITTFLVIYLFLKKFKESKNESLFFFINYFISCSLVSIIVYNENTFLRYRLPILTMYIFFLILSNYKKDKKNN